MTLDELVARMRELTAAALENIALVAEELEAPDNQAMLDRIDREFFS